MIVMRPTNNVTYVLLYLVVKFRCYVQYAYVKMEYQREFCVRCMKYQIMYGCLCILHSRSFLSNKVEQSGEN